MAIWKKVEPTKVFVGKLGRGSDLLEEISDVCRKEGILLGRVEALGAVQKARLGYYNQDTREYQFIDLSHPLEITKLVGNISLRDGQPTVHAHITLADREGKAYGGHLASGTKVFACEFIIQAFEGPLFERAFDQETGLPLWTISE
ncbi:MAG: PPC domain-containing DNA-binding protein [Pseudomonadota bacterium]